MLKLNYLCITVEILKVHAYFWELLKLMFEMWLEKKNLGKRCWHITRLWEFVKEPCLCCFGAKWRDPKQLMVLHVDFPVNVPVAWSAATETACICCTCSHWCDFHRESGSAHKIRSIFIQKYEVKTFFQLTVLLNSWISDLFNWFVFCFYMSNFGLEVESLFHLGLRRLLWGAQHDGCVYHQTQQRSAILERKRQNIWGKTLHFEANKTSFLYLTGKMGWNNVIWSRWWQGKLNLIQKLTPRAEEVFVV